MKQQELTERRLRAKQANALIQAIGGCGRRFFHQDGAYAEMTVRDDGRVWYRDEYTQVDIYTHYRGRWRKFTGGGTLRQLVDALRDFIVGTTEHIASGHFGPYPEWYSDGDPWGYGEDMKLVQKAALELGLVHEPKR